MTPTVRDVLIEARALLADPAHWTRYAFARDGAEVGCMFADPSACAFCAAGAVFRVLATHGEGRNPDLESDAFTALARAIVCPDAKNASHAARVTCLNDNGTHAEVLAMFDRAIQGM